MQHAVPYLAFLPLAAMVAVAEASPAAACEQLRDALGRELAALRTVQDAESAAAVLPELEAALSELAAMDRSAEAEKALWQYIDHTAGVKQPLLELIQSLSVEMLRLEVVNFYGNGALRALMAPQLPE